MWEFGVGGRVRKVVREISQGRSTCGQSIHIIVGARGYKQHVQNHCCEYISFASFCMNDIF